MVLTLLMGNTAINPRKAAAGLAMLAGSTVRAALIGAGYSPATARTPKRNGVSADQCIEAARALYPEAEPGEILRSSREVMGKRLKQLLSDDDELRKHGIGQIARLTDVVERWYGDRDARDTQRARINEVDWTANVLRAIERIRTERQRTIDVTNAASVSEDAPPTAT